MSSCKYNYAEIIQIYNSSGASEAYSHIRKQYFSKNPYSVIRYMKKVKSNHYDPETDRFIAPAAFESDNIFMNLDELCSKSSGLTPKATEAPSMEMLIKDLVQDRLLQLSQYVFLNQASKTIIVDRSSMIIDGFNVSIS